MKGVQRGCCEIGAAAASRIRKARTGLACGDEVPDFMCRKIVYRKGSSVSSSDHLSASLDRYFDVQHLGEGDAGDRVVAARFFKRGKVGRIAINAVALGAVDAACKQAPAKDDDRSA